MTRRSLPMALLALVLLAACGGGDDEEGAETTSAPTTATTVFDADRARTEITAMWTAQFSEATTVEQAVANLENGEDYRDAIVQQQTSGATKGLSVQVKNVQLSTPTAATVNYDILLSGTVALPATTGEAKWIDGGWKVSEKTFCALLSVGNIHPPACEKVLNTP